VHGTCVVVVLQERVSIADRFGRFGTIVMNTKTKTLAAEIRSLVVVLCSLVLVPGDTLAYMQSSEQAQSSTPSSGEEKAAPIPPDQLDALVAPIALYPDPLLAQTLAASTYPLEIIQLQQWLTKNPGLKDKALVDAVKKQPWDPSIQAMAALPDVVKRLAEDIQWTTDLGNAFLAQKSEVMDAVQRMRKKAQEKGNLKSNEQQKVETKVVESKSVIVVEQANPQIVYVPSYNPVVVYGPPVYPYPPVYYPPPGYYAAGMAISFGVGVAMGAAWGGGWGWGAGWGGNNDITVNRNNNFNRNTNISGGNRGVNAGNSWQHNSAHRGGAPYRDRSTANRYGGTARGDSLANRQAGARREVGRQGGNLASSRGGGGGISSRAGGTAGAGDRFGGGGAAGSRDVSRSSGDRGAFGGGSGEGFSGSSARASSSRGASSMGSFGGGGGRGGGRRR
jgi:hypothetical protein